jgi:dephospho-CoA kinase
MLVFGLTGGLASGKSTVAARFAARGVPVLDADVLARRAVEPGTEGLRAVTAAFGADLLDANGVLDRKALGARVFGDDAARKTLEGILHPRIHALMLAWKAELEAQGVPLACYEAPLLVEVGLADVLRPLVVVSAPPDEQIRRAVERDGLHDDAARARLAAQLPLAEKVKKADFVIENTGTREALIARTDEVLDAVLDRAGLPPERYPKPE